MSRAYRETCTDCGDACELDRGEYYCDDCADNAPLNSAARDYIRGGESRSDAGTIFETDPDDIGALQIDKEFIDGLQDIARGLDRRPWGIK